MQLLEIQYNSHDNHQIEEYKVWDVLIATHKKKNSGPEKADVNLVFAHSIH